MAERPIFLPSGAAPYVQEQSVAFVWFPGHALSQKQKSIASLHESARAGLGVERILEISTKSPERLGWSLSALNLLLTSSVTEAGITVEAAFQGSKVFSESGQQEWLYELADGREVKRQISEFSHEQVTRFSFEGTTWPANEEPRSAFYDWLYIRALQENVAHAPELEDEVVTYDGFTDIEFNPRRQVNCQARACAIYVGLSREQLLNEAADPDTYRKLVRSPNQTRLL